MSESKNALELLLASKRDKPPTPSKKPKRTLPPEAAKAVPVDEERAYDSSHPVNILGWEGSLVDLAAAIENMRYDKVAELLGHLSKCFLDRSKRDRAAGKHQLANALYNCHTRSDVVRIYTEDAWDICEPHMRVK
jgi:hypothetical protein